MSMKVSTYAKAIVGFVAPGVVTIGGALTVNSDGGGNVTAYEWVSALIACLVTGGFVYLAPNKPYAHLDRPPVDVPPVDQAPDPQPGLGHPDNLLPRPVTWNERNDDIEPH
jgi:hypothetical protein